MWNIENEEERGKRGEWKTRSVEKVARGKCGVWKMRSECEIGRASCRERV